MADANQVWYWRPFDPETDASSGDVSKLFKNEPVKVPGVLATDAPDPAAALLVREAIQNSWDSALERRRADHSNEPFEIRFRFRSESGTSRTRLVEHLGLRELADRSENVESR